MINKKAYYFLLVIFLCLFNYIRVNSYHMSLKGKVIYLDPGHGGVDSGAVYKDVVEDDINLMICNSLMTKLENLGATVYMTRYDDYDLSTNGATFRKRSDLSNRAQIINDSNADLYISIHLNSINSSTWNGVQIFYDDVNSQNKLLAQSLREAFDGKREISEISTKYMYKRIKVPGVLVELGFLSNSKDREILLNESSREKMVDKLVEGIISYNQDNN